MRGASAYIVLSPSFSGQPHFWHTEPTLKTIFCFVTDLSQTPGYDDLVGSDPANWASVRCFIRPHGERLRKATGREPETQEAMCFGHLRKTLWHTTDESTKNRKIGGRHDERRV